MPLSAGTRLGAYEILAPLGAGGMGEVYRARDTKLKRDVALKVLPDTFARDPERMARFQREAEVLASLNHPNIAQIYGVEERALVMELVEGETLKGPVPVETAVNYAKQIAEALDATHEKGVVHRDLKPGNIMITPAGAIKVLDFGLAAIALSPASGSGDPVNSPTLPMSVTRAGMIMGTAAYMSPEQARGKTVDKRTDIWAFGCVLYEMLSGKPAFQASTVTDTLEAIVTREPDWSALPATVPAWLRDLLVRLLEKDARRRLRDIGDARIEMERLDSAAAEMPASGRRAWPRISLWALLAMTVIAGIAVLSRLALPAASRVARLAVAIPPTEPLGIGLGPVAVISPDGRDLVYVVRRGGSTQLFRRPIDRYEAKPIAGTEGGYYPFFSPDGRWLGFFADHKLKKIALSGESLISLCDVQVSIGAVWRLDGTILFTQSPSSGISKVADAGGTPQVVTTPDRERGEVGHYWPEILPDEKSIMFTVAQSSGKVHIALQSLETGKRQILIENGNSARYAATGHVVFARGAVLMTVPFDRTGSRIQGQAATLVNNVLNTNTGGAQYSLSGEGSLVYVSGGVDTAKSTLEWIDRQGRPRPISAPPRAYMDPRISPDGKRLLLTIVEPTQSNAWVYNLARGTLTRLTFEGFENETSVWTPDGRTVLISSTRPGPPSNVILRKAADGGSGEERLWGSAQHAHLGSLSPDGRTLLFTGFDAIEGGNIFALPLAAGSRPRVIVQTPFHEWGPQFSPDGRWFAYVSNESGRDEVYVQAFPGPGSKTQVSTQGGSEPVWEHSGRELFYRQGDRIVTVAVTTGPSFLAGTPQVLFEGAYEKGLPLGHTDYDVSPDGKQFLMVKPGEQGAGPASIHVVLNWLENLKQAAPRAR